MKENDFNLDTTVREKKVFLKKIRIVFTAALFLTGVLSFLGLMMSAWGIKNRIWLQMGLADFVWNMVLTAGITPELGNFSKLLIILIMFIGRLGAFTLASMWVCRPAPHARYIEESIIIG